MDITLEISTKLSSYNENNCILSDVGAIASLLGATKHYTDFEIAGASNHVKRNHYVMTIVFEKGYPPDIAQIITYILSLKDVYLECVYDETHTTQMIFCSSYYRKYCLNKLCNDYETIKTTTTRRQLETILEEWRNAV